MNHRLQKVDAEKKTDMCEADINNKKHEEEEIMIYKFYKPILVALLCFGIDMLPRSLNSYRYLRIIIIAVNGILILATILIGIKSIANFNTEFTLSFITLTGISFKYFLFKKRTGIFDFIMDLNKNQCMIKCIPYIQAVRKNIICLLIFVLISPIILCIITILQLKENAIEYEVISLGTILKQYNVTKVENVTYAESILNLIIPLIFTILPMNVLFILYSVISWQLKTAFNYFKNHIQTNTSFPQIFREYNQLYNLIKGANDLFSFIILYAIVIISCIIYFNIYCLFSSWKNIGLLNILALLPGIFYFCGLFAMIYVAAGITDVNDEIHELVLNLNHDSLSANDKMFLVIKTQKELGMSVGNQVVMKRGFFFTLIGTIFTYLLLTKSFFPN